MVSIREVQQGIDTEEQAEDITGVDFSPEPVQQSDIEDTVETPTSPQLETGRAEIDLAQLGNAQPLSAPVQPPTQEEELIDLQTTLETIDTGEEDKKRDEQLRELEQEMRNL